jgi:hypothetical protein
MDEMVESEHWDTAAARWNHFVQQVYKVETARETVKGLHFVTGDILQHSYLLLHRRRASERELSVIRTKAERPQKDWVYKSAQELKLTEYENAELVDLVRKHTVSGHGIRSKRTKRIDWHELAYKWIMKYETETSAGFLEHVHPRTKNVLKSHWQSLNLTRKNVAAEGAGKRRRSALTSTSSASSALDVSQPELNFPVISTQPQPVLAVSPADGDDFLLSYGPEDGRVIQPQLESSSLQDVGVSSLSPSSILQSPSASGPLSRVSEQLGRLGASAVLAARNLFGSEVSDSSAVVARTSPVALPASESDVLASAVPDPPAVDLTEAQERCPILRWSLAATVKFNELSTRHPKWIYEKFTEVWPEQEFGKVSRVRFYNKNRIEKRKRVARLAAAAPVLPPPLPPALWPRDGDKRQSPKTPKGMEYAEEMAKRRRLDNE